MMDTCSYTRLRELQKLSQVSRGVPDIYLRHRAMIELADEDPRIRGEMCYGLGMSGRPQFVDLLSPLLDDPNQWVQVQAHRAVQRLRQPSAEPAVRMEPDCEWDGQRSQPVALSAAPRVAPQADPSSSPPRPNVRLGTAEVAACQRAASSAQLPESSVAIVEAALGREAFGMLLVETAPDLEGEVSRFGAASGQGLLDELFPAADLAVNGWWVEFQLMPAPVSSVGIDAVFAGSSAHPDFYVVFGVEGGASGLNLQFRGWLTWSQALRRPVPGGGAGRPQRRIELAALNESWHDLVAELREARPTRPAVRACGCCPGDHEQETLLAEAHAILDSPAELPVERYEHWLHCPRCRFRGIRLLVKERARSGCQP